MSSSVTRWLKRASLRYALALASVLAALLLTLALARWNGPKPIISFAFLVAILASARWGGYGPGVLASLLTLFGAPFLLRPDFKLSQVNPATAIELILISVLLSRVVASRAGLRQSNQMLDERVRQRTQELERANEALRQREALLVRQADELARSNADLQRFAYVASHDLQEPVRMIGIYSEFLAKRYRGKLDEEADGFIRTILDGAHRMDQLIRDLLVYSRVIHAESSAIAEVNVQDALAAAISNLEASILESGAKIEAQGLPTIHYGSTEITQLFQNLIGNAIKYRREAPVITIRAENRGTEWVFSVADNGIGIRAEYLESIFTPFKRLHGREYPGTGIGLAICRRIVERRGGRVWAESEPGTGSTFYFTVPHTQPSRQVLSEVNHRTLAHTATDNP